MKVWRAIGLGLLIWSLNLIWPEISDWLIQPLSLKVIVGLATSLLVFDLLEYFGRTGDQSGSNHHSNSSPIPRGSA